MPSVLVTTGLGQVRSWLKICMIRLLLACTTIPILMAATPTPGQEKSAGPRTFRIAFTKNLRGALGAGTDRGAGLEKAGGVPSGTGRGRLADLVLRVKKERHTLYFDTGNALVPDRFAHFGKRANSGRLPGGRTPGTLDDLKAEMVGVVSRLRDLGPSAVVPGEEDFALGGRFYVDLMKSAGIPVVCANLFHPGSTRTVFPSYRLLMVHGCRVVVLGVMTDACNIRPLAGSFSFHLADPIDLLEVLVPKIRKREDPDLVLLLSHMGILEDLDLARHHEGIPVVLGGRSENVFDRPYQGSGNVPDPIHIYHPPGMGEGIGLVRVTCYRSGAPFRDITVKRQQEEVFHRTERQLASLESSPSPKSDRESRDRTARIRTLKARLASLKKSLDPAAGPEYNTLEYFLIRS